MKKKPLLLILTIFLLIGCSHSEMKFSLLTNSKFELSQAQNYTRLHKKVKGSEITNLYFIFRSGGSSNETAMKDALKGIPGAVGLINGKIIYGFWTALIFGRAYMHIEGYPLVDPEIYPRNSL